MVTKCGNGKWPLNGSLKWQAMRDFSIATFDYPQVRKLPPNRFQSNIRSLYQPKTVVCSSSQRRLSNWSWKMWNPKCRHIGIPTHKEYVHLSPCWQFQIGISYFLIQSHTHTDIYIYMGVSIYGVTPKRMVYKWKFHENWWFGGTPISGNSHIYIYIYIPVVPHKAVAEVSKIGHYRRGELLWCMDGRANPHGPKGGLSCVFWNGCSGCGGHLTDNCWMWCGVVQL